LETIELKHPIPLFNNKEKTEIKYLTPGRLKVKHFKLLPESLMALADKKEDKKLSFTPKELVPVFNDLIPFLAGIFNLPKESIEEIDFDDIEAVISCLDEVFPKDEKKN
jgi:hypothetical protein